MTIYTIYRATNKINGKVYIGYTKNFKNRLESHRANYTRIDNKFYNAIKKYSWDAFVWEEIYQSLDGEFCNNTMEPFFIIEHNSIKSGYNVSPGGNIGPTLYGSDNGMFGKNHTEETKQLQRSLKLGKSNIKVKGVPKSPDHKKKIAYTLIGKNVGHKSSTYDHTVYEFRHVSGIIERCTTYEIRMKYSLSAAGISNIKTGRRNIHHGWTIHTLPS
jgi:group I intron endonuclease